MEASVLPAPVADLPVLSVRWEGLVVTIDATTINTIIHRSIEGIREIREILVEPEDGHLGLTVRLKRGIAVPLRGRIEGIRFREGFLGFRVEGVTAFGFVPVPKWIFRRIAAAQPPGRAFWYPDERIFVVNVGGFLPPELSLRLTRVVCDAGEVRFHFGPSSYRLNRLVSEIGRDPFRGD